MDGTEQILTMATTIPGIILNSRVYTLLTYLNHTLVDEEVFNQLTGVFHHPCN